MDPGKVKPSPIVIHKRLGCIKAASVNPVKFRRSPWPIRGFGNPVQGLSPFRKPGVNQIPVITHFVHLRTLRAVGVIWLIYRSAVFKMYQIFCCIQYNHPSPVRRAAVFSGRDQHPIASVIFIIKNIRIPPVNTFIISGIRHNVRTLLILDPCYGIITGCMADGLRKLGVDMITRIENMIFMIRI